MGTNADTLNRLLELTKKLLEIPSLDGALKSVTDAALDLLPSEHTSLRVFDTSRTMLLCSARSGVGIDNRPMEFREGEGILGWVARHGQPALVHDTSEDPRFKDGEAQGFEVKSLFAVPLLSAGEVMGVLGGTSSKTGAFSAENETLAMLLANCAVPAIDRERVKRLALVDPETMAFTESFLQCRLEEELGRASRHDLPLSILRVCVDHLEPRGQGIRFLADTIRFALRRTDILFRAGGSAFLVVLPHTDLRPASAVAERLSGTLKVTMLSESLRLWPSRLATTTWDRKETADQLQQRSAAALAETQSE